MGLVFSATSGHTFPVHGSGCLCPSACPVLLSLLDEDAGGIYNTPDVSHELVSTLCEGEVLFVVEERTEDEGGTRNTRNQPRLVPGVLNGLYGWSGQNARGLLDDVALWLGK